MRAGILVAGLVLLIIGAVLLMVPVESQNLSVNTPHDIYYNQAVSAFKINSPIVSQTFVTSWSSNISGTFYYAVCSQIPGNPNPNMWASSGGCTASGNSSGASGSFTVSGANGNYLVLGFCPSSKCNSTKVPVSVSAAAKTTVPTAGIILIVVGLILALVGVATKKKKAAPPRPPAQPNQIATQIAAGSPPR